MNKRERASTGEKGNTSCGRNWVRIEERGQSKFTFENEQNKVLGLGGDTGK